MHLQDLPVDIIAGILSELDLKSLVTVAYLSTHLRVIASDTSLNPWRRPILRNLRSKNFESELAHLSVRSIVPRQNWIEILSIAPASYLLFEATLPNLPAADWEECFRRRFLPGWQKRKKDTPWREAYMKVLHRVWHRSLTPCTIDEAWTKYIVLNRNGTANQLEMTSRGFNPMTMFNDIKLQSDLAHLETRVRLVIEFADVRVLAFGTLHRPPTRRTVNANALALLHPPGIDAPVDDKQNPSSTVKKPVADHGVYPQSQLQSPTSPTSPPHWNDLPVYDRLKHPLPKPCHANYPFYTPGGMDKRWIGTGPGAEGEGMEWVGGLMLCGQIIGPHIHEITDDWIPLQDLDLVVGPGRHQYASFTWEDLWTIAPWLEERIIQKIDGPGLGVH